MADTTYGPQRAARLLNRHRADTGLEGDPEIIATHLLGDLIEWCDANNIDFDLLVQNTREMLREAR